MKKILTLLFSAFISTYLNAQAILNEVYAIPGNAKQEFFEFYNSSSIPFSMDNYTLVTYFEVGPTKGFYVMDLPNLVISSRGYFVGSSAIPFDYQGVSNSTNSQFSWNDLAFLSTNNGFLKKWVMGNSVSAAIDGNANYDLAPLPANFNDFFNRIGGADASYNVIVYKNGIMQSIFLGGTGGTTFLPTYILGLPSLHVDVSGSSPDFDINFSGYGSANTEYVTQDAGSDNGYIRQKDGFCGAWTKSSSQVTHTPGITNGGATYEIEPDISVASFIHRGSVTAGSTVEYNVVAGPAIDFPVTLHVYADNGTVPGELDANDTYVESKTENTLSDGPFNTVFFPYLSNIIIQTTTSAGCIDHVLAIPNTGVLPIKLVSFQGLSEEGGSILKWTVTDNESGKYFEIEKSGDGRNFSRISTINNSNKQGVEAYSFTDGGNGSAYYRIRLMDQSGKSFYSNVVFVASGRISSNQLTLLTNPVESYLSISYAASSNSVATLNIYNISGVAVHSQKINLNKGSNAITLSADGKLYTGAYILQIINEKENSRTKFIKR